MERMEMMANKGKLANILTLAVVLTFALVAATLAYLLPLFVIDEFFSDPGGLCDVMSDFFSFIVSDCWDVLVFIRIPIASIFAAIGILMGIFVALVGLARKRWLLMFGGLAFMGAFIVLLSEWGIYLMDYLFRFFTGTRVIPRFIIDIVNLTGPVGKVAFIIIGCILLVIDCIFLLQKKQVKAFTMVFPIAHLVLVATFLGIRLLYFHVFNEMIWDLFGLEVYRMISLIVAPLWDFSWPLIGIYLVLAVKKVKPLDASPLA